MNELPLRSFDEIEDIIAPKMNKDLNVDIYGTKQI